jgi:hypothetical protein
MRRYRGDTTGFEPLSERCFDLQTLAPRTFPVFLRGKHLLCQTNNGLKEVWYVCESLEDMQAITAVIYMGGYVTDPSWYTGTVDVDQCEVVTELPLSLSAPGVPGRCKSISELAASLFQS